MPKPFNPRKTLFVFSVLLGLTIWTFYFRDIQGPKHYHWSGPTMGTRWTIKVYRSDLNQKEAKALYQEVLGVLDSIIDQMSTYEPESEISRLNQSEPGTPISISSDFQTVFVQAAQLTQKSNGAFNPTIYPLIDLWGFTGKLKLQKPPNEEEITSAMNSMGLQHIDTGESTLTRKIDSVRLDLNAIAKGYAVDALSDRLASASLQNYMIEIGGEVRVLGTNEENQPWAMGIQSPLRDETGEDHLFGIVSITNLSMATSGDYRNFYQTEDGSYATHILDPRTGRPAIHTLASVTVLAPTCIQADGLATAAYVMGPEEGLTWLEAMNDVEALLIIRNPDDTFQILQTSGFQELSEYKQID